MWKAPNRPTHEITQGFNDGIVAIYSVKDIAEPGYQPKKGLAPKCTLRYEEQRLGIQRNYMAKQNQIQIEHILRVPAYGEITNQDIAILAGNSQQYRIDLVQSVEDSYPKSVDITLYRIEQAMQIVGEAK